VTVRRVPRGAAARRTGLSPAGCRVLVALVAVGLAVRVAIAFATYGVPFDIDSAAIVAHALRTPGMGPYPTHRWPYPPGFFPFIVLADRTAAATGLPFHGLIQLPAIAADGVLAVVIAAFLRRGGRTERAALTGAALVALGPSFAIISGYHGQIDAVAILPAVLGAVVWCAGGSRRAALAGVLIGLGAAVKTVPLFAALALLPTARSRREAATLLAAAAAVPVLAVLPWLVADHVNTLSALTQNRGVPGFGGLSAFAQPAVTRFWASLQHPVPGNDVILFLWRIQNLVVGAAVLATAALLLSRRARAVDGLALLWLTVLAVNPNFAFQYVVWTLPFLLLAGRLRTVALLEAALLAPSVLLYTHWDGSGWIYWATMQAAWLAIVAAWAVELRAAMRRPVAPARS
jgi:hypothetical protein